MSGRRSQGSSNTITNPASPFIEFQGAKGHFQYYDKSTKKNVSIDKFTFLIVSEFSTITGFNQLKGSSIYSNEITSQDSEELDVRYFRDKNTDKKNIPIVKGLYADIKDTVTSRSVGGKFTTSIYIALYHGGEWKLSNIKLSGKQLGEWIELNKRIVEKSKELNINNLKYQCLIKIKSIEFVSGSIDYYYPVFDFIILDEDNPKHKASLIKADNYYDIIEDYQEKKKAGITEEAESGRKSQGETTSKATKTAKPVEQKQEEEASPFADTDDDDADDMPF